MLMQNSIICPDILVVVWHYKTNTMKPGSTPRTDSPSTIVREILLFNITHGLSHSFDHSPQDVWAGLYGGILAEIPGYAGGDCRLFIWEVLPAKHFVWVRQGTYPQLIEGHTSIDPYCFLLAHPQN